MQPRQFSEVYAGNFLGFWNSLAVFDKPLIAAVNGFAVSLVGNIYLLFLFYYCLYLLHVLTARYLEYW